MLPSRLLIRWLWTLAILAVYSGGRYLPVPILNLEALEGATGNFESGSLLALGVVPFLIGFAVVELFSLLTPWSRKARRNGAQGRRTINRWAVACSLAVCVLQSFALTFSLEHMVTPDGFEIVTSPGGIL